MHISSVKHVFKMATHINQERYEYSHLQHINNAARTPPCTSLCMGFPLQSTKPLIAMALLKRFFSTACPLHPSQTEMDINQRIGIQILRVIATTRSIKVYCLFSAISITRPTSTNYSWLLMSLSSADLNNEIGHYKSTTSIEKHY